LQAHSAAALLRQTLPRLVQHIPHPTGPRAPRTPASIQAADHQPAPGASPSCRPGGGTASAAGQRLVSVLLAPTAKLLSSSGEYTVAPMERPALPLPAPSPPRLSMVRPLLVSLGACSSVHTDQVPRQVSLRRLPRPMPAAPASCVGPHARARPDHLAMRRGGTTRPPGRAQEPAPPGPAAAGVHPPPPGGLRTFLGELVVR